VSKPAVGNPLSEVFIMFELFEIILSSPIGLLIFARLQDALTL
jgi:hypothetical protein